MKPCIDCGNETDRGMFCPRCDCLAVAYCYATSHWRAEEMNDLIDTLRINTVKELKRDRKGAFLLQRLLRHIETLCPAYCQPDSIKTSLCSRLTKYLVHKRSVTDYDAKNGEGAHKAIYRETMEDLRQQLTEVYTNKHITYGGTNP